jgi:hypothetical protein
MGVFVVHLLVWRQKELVIIFWMDQVCEYLNFPTNLFFSHNLTVVCVESCPEEVSYTKFICHYDIQANVTADTTYVTGMNTF